LERCAPGHEIDTIFASLAQLRVGALVIASDAFFTAQSNQIAAWTLRGAVPALSTERLFPEAGGLMSYGGRFSEVYRQAALYAGRILKGEKPANLPIVQATKIELVINLNTAKALGLTVPITLLARADEVIE
jgi:putative tryptophan/tyrosine transport system substrate-binding protein